MNHSFAGPDSRRPPLHDATIHPSRVLIALKQGIRRSSRRCFAPILASILAVVAGVDPASSQTATDAFEVRITLGNECTIAVDDMDFGLVTDLSTAHDTQVGGSVTCTGIAPISVEFDPGTGGSSTFTTRQLGLGQETINYNLYRDAARTEILGDGTGGTFTIGFTSSAGADPFTIYARTAGGQGPKPSGTYASDLVATVTF